MKKIIHGKKYDTETARKLAGYWNGLSSTDFRCMSEILYRKRNGEYFLYGKGGALTKYGERIGNSRCEGENIVPLTEDEAKAWVEEYANPLYEGIFGEVQE